MKFLANLKEYFRKLIVRLKRKPETIPLLAIIFCMMLYTFKLGTYSAASIYCANDEYYVAIFVFLITLFSILSIFTYLGVKDRKGFHIVKFILAVIMLGGIGTLDWFSYVTLHRNAIAEPERVQLAQSAHDSLVHMIALGITILLVLTEPFYAKLLKKIKTTVADSEFDDDDDDSEVITEDE